MTNEWKTAMRNAGHGFVAADSQHSAWALLCRAVALAAVVLAGGRAWAQADDEESSRPPNIIFIMADDLGYGDLGCYGQQRIKTPNIDRLAAEGMKFTNYYAGSTVCAPSRYVLMTGVHLGRGYIRGNSKMSIRVGDVTVAEVLKLAGYRCGMFGKWGLGQEGTAGLPSNQGFDAFYGYLDQHHAHNYYPSFLIRGREREPLKNVVPGEGAYGTGVATEKNEYSHDLIWAEAIKFLEASKDEPFFLYLPVTIPHANNEARQAGMEIPDYGQYASEDWPDPQKGLAAMISRLDSDVGLLMELLKQYGIDEQTIVFFTSDNGPHKEGGNDPEFFDSNGPLRGIKRDFYEGGIRVPMLVRWPGKIAPGSQTDLLFWHGDLMATAAELANAPRVPVGLDSASYVPTLLGKPEEQWQHEWLYWEFYEKGFKQAVRSDHWKAIRHEKDNERLELYNLEQDPAEEHNVAGTQREVAEKLAHVMDIAHVPNPDWPIDPRRARRMRQFYDR